MQSYVLTVVLVIRFRNYFYQKKKKSCEMEDLVEIHLCKLLVNSARRSVESVFQIKCPPPLVKDASFPTRTYTR